jgi:lipid II:glycine glycyltransferase (peptidoglycan interpeptide bridge formation enzyme)
MLTTREDAAGGPGEAPPGPQQHTIIVQTIDATTHAVFARTHSVSFLQAPEWAAVKPGWRSESLGWFAGRVLVGVALVLYRPVPGTRRSLAYTPEGPALPWAAVSQAPAAWLEPFVAHLRAQGAFAVRIGPSVPVRLWRPGTAKRALADPQLLRFADLEPDQRFPVGERVIGALRGQGWRTADGEDAGSKGGSSPSGRGAGGSKGGRGGNSGGGFGSGQPKFVLRLPLADRTVPQLLAGTNQQWRRNVTRSARAGVVVREGGFDDLTTFHRLYRETAQRDGFTARPAGYFEQMWRALRPGGDPMLRLYLAELGPDGEPLAAALVVQVGKVCWYSYGASSGRHRQAQASTAVQWTAICAAKERGCDVYDLRGITDTLDQADPLSGLLRFKLGLGADCVELAGEWELTLSPLWHRAFRTYQRIR